MRVLLIDDDPATVELVQDRLLSEGCEVEMSWGPDLDHLRGVMDNDALPDVVLLDLGLPESQGLDTFDMAYSIIRDRVPIVILSGTQPYSAGLKAMRNGAEHFVDKKHLDQVELGVALCRAVDHFEKAAILRRLTEDSS